MGQLDEYFRSTLNGIALELLAIAATYRAKNLETNISLLEYSRARALAKQVTSCFQLPLLQAFSLFRSFFLFSFGLGPMDSPRRPHLLSLSTPARPISTSPTQHTPSQSPFRYVHFPETMEKETPLQDITLDRTPSSSRFPASPLRRAHHSAPSSPAHHNRRPSSLSPPYSRPRGLRIANLLRPWIPLIVYGLSSLILVVAIAFFKTQVFTCTASATSYF